MGIKIIPSSQYRCTSISSSSILKMPAFFRAKLEANVCPRVNNQLFGDTLQELTRPLADQSPSDSCLSMNVGASFWVTGCPSWHQPATDWESDTGMVNYLQVIIIIRTSAQLFNKSIKQ